MPLTAAAGLCDDLGQVDGVCCYNNLFNFNSSDVELWHAGMTPGRDAGEAATASTPDSRLCLTRRCEPPEFIISVCARARRFDRAQVVMKGGINKDGTRLAQQESRAQEGGQFQRTSIGAHNLHTHATHK